MEAWKKREIGVFLGLLGILLVSLVSGSALAQTITGAVTGTVIDTSGAIVPGASVTLKSEATEVARSGVTNDSGVFVFDSVQPGIYTVIVEKAGFKRHEQKGLSLSSNQRLGLGSISMELGEVTQTVSVTSTGELVSTGECRALGCAHRYSARIDDCQGSRPVELAPNLAGG